MLAQGLLSEVKISQTYCWMLLAQSHHTSMYRLST